MMTLERRGKGHLEPVHVECGAVRGVPVDRRGGGDDHVGTLFFKSGPLDEVVDRAGSDGDRNIVIVFGLFLDELHTHNPPE